MKKIEKMFHHSSSGAPIPVKKGSQMPSLLSPLASSLAGFGFRAIINNGEQYTPSTTTDEDLVRQTALTFFPSHQHEHLIRSVDSATWRGTDASSSAAEG